MPGEGPGAPAHRGWTTSGLGLQRIYELDAGFGDVQSLDDGEGGSAASEKRDFELDPEAGSVEVLGYGPSA